MVEDDDRSVLEEVVVVLVFGVGRVVAVGVFFEDGEVIGLEEEDDDPSSVLEVVVVVAFFLPSPSLLLVSFLVVLLDCIDTTEGLIVFCVRLRVLLTETIISSY